MDKILTELEHERLTPIPTTIDPGGALKSPVQCLMCDIYGTLFISGSGDIGVSRRQSVPRSKVAALLARYRIDRTAEDLLNSLHAAIDAHHTKARADGVEHPEVKIDEIWAQVVQWDTAQKARSFALDFETIMNPVWPMPGLARLLKTCRDEGIVMGIISNAQFFTLSLFERFMGDGASALGFHPDLLILSYRYGLAKPSADLFRLAASRLKQMGLSAENTAFIGNDMGNDIVPARDAGFQTILFAGDARSLRMREEEPRCAGVEPDLVATRLDQVIPFLQNR